ncbi:MAG TPA: response regulator [Gemmataceae bacterium]|nr:response regulator [Gemmataceae bacterium]
MPVPDPLRVLLVEDRPSDARLMLDELRAAGFNVAADRVETEADYLARLDPPPDVILCDYSLPQFGAPRALELVRASGRDVPLVIVSGSIGEETAVEAMKAGAADYLLKDRLGRLGSAVRQAVAARQLREAERRAQAALAEQARGAAVRGAVAVAVARSGELAAILEECCEVLVAEAGAALARVWTVDDAGQALELRASAGLTRETGDRYARVPVGRHKVGRIALDRRPELTEALADDPWVDREWVAREGVTAFAGYPLLVEGRLVGVLAVFSRAPIGPAAFGHLAGVADLVAQFVERKRAEELLRLRDRAIQATSQGILITDPSRPDNPIVYASPGFERLTGYSAAEALGRNCRFLQGPDTDPAAVAIVRAAVRDDRPCSVELVNHRKDGSPFWNALAVTPVRDGDRLTHFIGVLTDVTARKHLEAQFHQAQKMEAVGQLAGGVAHDFNNLLTVINGYADLLLTETPAADATRESIAVVREAGERAAALTSQLLAFSRKSIVAPTVLDLNLVLDQVGRLLRRLIEEDVTLSIDLAPGLSRVKADPVHLEQLILNLAVNARDAMPGGGRLTVGTAEVGLAAGDPALDADCPPGRYVRLTVADTGTGMPPDVQARIFEPFFTTKAPGKGTGLGLATVYGIVKLAGGSIRVASTVGKGTTFTVYVPAAPGGATAPAATATAGPVARGDETILLVEDEPAVRKLARIALEAKGYRVLEAGNGMKALQEAERYSGPIHLLVTDVVMPEMGGRQLAEALSAKRPGVKILYMSGYTDDAVVRHGVSEAADRFLQKPFGPAALTAKVRAVLDSAFGGASGR